MKNSEPANQSHVCSFAQVNCDLGCGCVALGPLCLIFLFRFLHLFRHAQVIQLEKLQRVVSRFERALSIQDESVQ